MSDFGLVPSPVRLSSLAILVTCWLSLSLARPKLRHRLYLVVLGLAVGFTAAGALAVGAQHGWPWWDTAAAGAVTLAVLLLTLVARDELFAREEVLESAVLAGIGRTELVSLDAFLQDLAERGALGDLYLM